MMKKNISYIPMDSALEIWLLEKLLRDPPDSDYAKDLLSGIQEMIRGEVSSLLLGSSEESDCPVGTLSDRILAGDLEIYPRGRKVLIKGSEVNLTPKEFDILYFLVQNKGEVFTKEQIYRAVWEEDYLLDNSNIMAFIRKLRKKIEPAPDSPTYILTIWGIGYKFNDQI
ncbi:transcriptional regulatory protein, C-terminal domain protein [Clostridioides difficile NAP08]|uniref:Transcriptional regulatory protein, C-terminal domain protein n=2 Tax=Clostridioides difficile TaxID=1496 RepID=D5PZW6_CLODI|nr:transcriptional regulatory protein, C-terminal domain protein [Clostridioides difficile NAP08]EFH14043.1 transcriptional regulatory protein, C-terminal domain protein [Clostridioides difficile NAP07]CCK89207.1 Putative transcriptional regulator Tn916-like,CTn7-Orf11 [Clostridioides difficile T5]CCK92585.1 Putative transcriptional regulator Tn916-like,CTn7-Orf11 [Clostridioides difficile T20]CCK96348.1 Putative transcriptional regulator Tn916-like,CTn7-Orf11 [Clostridioides difficile E1]CCL0